MGKDILEADGKRDSILPSEKTPEKKNLEATDGKNKDSLLLEKEFSNAIEKAPKDSIMKRLTFSVSGSKITISNSDSAENSKKIDLFCPPEYYKHLSDGESGNTLIDQLIEVLYTPGLAKLVALPDMHAGKIFPVGISAVYDLSIPECKIIPDLIGSDVNCGVRVWVTSITKERFLEKRDLVLSMVKEGIPIENREIGDGNSIDSPADGTIYQIEGIGTIDINRVIKEGIGYLVSNGMASDADQACTESLGAMEVASSSILSQKAKVRGMRQIGTLGNGNHYLEFQAVSEIFNAEVCKDLGVSMDSICVSVHTGSRGLGGRAVHEYITEYSRYKNSKGICEIPINSVPAMRYLQMVNACSNYAFCNRVLIGRSIKGILTQIFDDCSMQAISDSAHNVMRKEGSMLLARKGSTKLQNRNSSENRCEKEEKKLPNVVSVGGSMTTGSYLLETGPNSNDTNNTTCHGSGRIIRRKDAKFSISVDDTIKEIEDAGVVVSAGKKEHISEESSKTYKCINKVVEYCEAAGISNRVCRLIPIAVLKG